MTCRRKPFPKGLAPRARQLRRRDLATALSPDVAKQRRSAPIGVRKVRACSLLLQAAWIFHCESAPSCAIAARPSFLESLQPDLAAAVWSEKQRTRTVLQVTCFEAPSY